MAICTRCGAPIEGGQRLCRVCGTNLDQSRPGEGAIARFFRRLFGGVSVHVGGGTAPGTERLTVRTVVRDRRGSADPESLPREVRQAMEEALKDPAASSGSRAKSLGPVTVSTVTTTRTYHSLEEMPPEVRQWAEAMLREAPERGSQSIVVTIDGETRTYDRLEDVPEPHRQAVAAARQRGA